MLYKFARPYDEYEGEDYDGSSCRGALKGWFHHGVCPEQLWRYDAGPNSLPKTDWDIDTQEQTLGVYFRVDRMSIVDMQAAISEVGAVYVSAYTHNGCVNHFHTRDSISQTLQYQACVAPDAWFRSQTTNKKRLVIYVLGGLNSESAAITRVRAMGRYFLQNGCYPLFMVWKSGMRESFSDVLHDRIKVPAEQPGLAGNWFADNVSDPVLEKTVGKGLAKPLWAEMKENAMLASESARGADLMANAMDPHYSGWDRSAATTKTLDIWHRTLRSTKLKQRTTLHDEAEFVVTRDKPGIDGKMEKASHGGFDNSVEVIGKTLELITRGKLTVPVDDLAGF